MKRPNSGNFILVLLKNIVRCMGWNLLGPLVQILLKKEDKNLPHCHAILSHLLEVICDLFLNCDEIFGYVQHAVSMHLFSDVLWNRFAVLKSCWWVYWSRWKRLILAPSLRQLLFSSSHYKQVSHLFCHWIFNTWSKYIPFFLKQMFCGDVSIVGVLRGINIDMSFTWKKPFGVLLKA